MAAVIGQTVRAWTAGTLALLATGGGVSALFAGGSAVSPVRSAVAAVVLSIFTATLALVVTSPGARTTARCLLWGGTVPVLVAAVNVALVSVSAGLPLALLRSLPWLAGLGVAAVGTRLPGLQLPHWWPERRRSL